MPFAQITIVEGRSKEMKAELIHEMTEAIHKSLGAPKERIRVAIYEVKKSEWGVAGETLEAMGR